jgi:ubiquinone/menaquinone biosynthesis C-methylase UbiE
LSDLDRANQELSRVLESGGRFLIITANPGSYAAWKGFYTHYKVEGNRLEGTMQLTENQKSHDVLFLYEEEEIMSSMSKAGLTVQTTQTFRQSSKENTDLLIAIEGRKI